MIMLYEYTIVLVPSNADKSNPQNQHIHVRTTLPESRREIAHLMGLPLATGNTEAPTVDTAKNESKRLYSLVY
jgi:hypothetical protein